MTENDHDSQRELVKLTPETCKDIVNPGPLRYPALKNLQESAQDHPDDGDIRNQLGEALWRSAFDETQDHLAELRHLAVTYPGDPAPRKWLAKTLYALLYFEGEENNLVKYQERLRELRELRQSHPTEVDIAEAYAMAISYAHARVVHEDRATADALLQDLRDVARDFAYSRSIQEWLNSTTELQIAVDERRTR